jgi:hypothetical protein
MYMHIHVHTHVHFNLPFPSYLVALIPLCVFQMVPRHPVQEGPCARDERGVQGHVRAEMHLAPVQQLPRAVPLDLHLGGGAQARVPAAIL